MSSVSRSYLRFIEARVAEYLRGLTRREVEGLVKWF